MKIILFIMVILFVAIAIPYTAFAAISVEIHDGSDNPCNNCQSFTGLSLAKDTSPSNKTIGPVTFSYLDSYNAQVEIASGYTIKYIVIQAGTDHKMYTVYDNGPFVVDSTGITDAEGSQALISHISVWYESDAIVPPDEESKVAGAKDSNDDSPKTGDNSNAIMTLLFSALILSAAGINQVVQNKR